MKNTLKCIIKAFFEFKSQVDVRRKWEDPWLLLHQVTATKFKHKMYLALSREIHIPGHIQNLSAHILLLRLL